MFNNRTEIYFFANSFSSRVLLYGACNRQCKHSQQIEKATELVVTEDKNRQYIRNGGFHSDTSYSGTVYALPKHGRRPSRAQFCSDPTHVHLQYMCGSWNPNHQHFNAILTRGRQQSHIGSPKKLSLMAHKNITLGHHDQSIYKGNDHNEFGLTDQRSTMG